MEPRLSWYAEIDPETGDPRASEEPFYTWSSGWARLTPRLVTDPNTLQRSVELIPALDQLGEGSLFEYTPVLIPVDLNRIEPLPPEVRRLGSLEMIEMMLRIIGIRNQPVLEGPFNSGLMKTASNKTPTGRRFDGKLISRQDKYVSRIQRGAPTDFAIIVREEAERWRQGREFSPTETGFLKRMYYDMAKEIALRGDIDLIEAETHVQRAFGGDPFAVSTRKMRKPRKPKPKKK